MEFNDKPATAQPEYVSAQLVERPAPPRKKKSRFGLFVTLVLLLGLGGSLLFNGVLLVSGGSSDGGAKVEEKYFSHAKRAANKIAILNLDGVILDGDSYVKRQIERVRKDTDVKAIVLRVDSPGGTVSGSDYIHHHLQKMLKEREIPMVVSMGSIAASGGYYVSMAVGSTPGTIFAEPTTWTGSIGVMIPHYDASQLLNEHGVRQDSVVSHPLKGMASYTKAMSPEERKILQSLVDDSFARFKGIVRQGRPNFQTPEGSKALDALATGQVYTAQQALAGGLIDKIGFVEDAVERAIELSGLAEGEVRVVEYKKEFSLRDLLIGSKAQSNAWGPAPLLEMATPRAYYLWSWLPPVFSARGR